MKIIHSTDRSVQRRSAHDEPGEPVQRSVAVELLDDWNGSIRGGGSRVQPSLMIYHFDVSGIPETWKFPI